MKIIKQPIETKPFNIVRVAELFNVEIDKIIDICSKNDLPITTKEDGTKYISENSFNKIKTILKAENTNSNTKDGGDNIGKEKSISGLLVVSILLGVVLTVVAFIIAMLSPYENFKLGAAFLNVAYGVLDCVIIYYLLKGFLWIFKTYYPTSKIPAFNLFKITSCLVFIFIFLGSIAGHIIIVVNFINFDSSMIFLNHLIASGALLVSNLIGLLICEIFSYDYNKAVLMEKICDNTEKNDK